jgi:hypothetical protein
METSIFKIEFLSPDKYAAWELYEVANPQGGAHNSFLTLERR